MLFIINRTAIIIQNLLFFNLFWLRTTIFSWLLFVVLAANYCCLWLKHIILQRDSELACFNEIKTQVPTVSNCSRKFCLWPLQWSWDKIVVPHSLQINLLLELHLATEDALFVAVILKPVLCASDNSYIYGTCLCSFPLVLPLFRKSLSRIILMTGKSRLAASGAIGSFFHLLMTCHPCQWEENAF
jgi:hypothetical protein